jgi:hypothetical protein
MSNLISLKLSNNKSILIEKKENCFSVKSQECGHLFTEDLFKFWFKTRIKDDHHCPTCFIGVEEKKRKKTSSNKDKDENENPQPEKKIKTELDRVTLKNIDYNVYGIDRAVQFDSFISDRVKKIGLVPLTSYQKRIAAYYSNNFMKKELNSFFLWLPVGSGKTAMIHSLFQIAFFHFKAADPECVVKFYFVTKPNLRAQAKSDNWAMKTTHELITSKISKGTVYGRVNGDIDISQSISYLGYTQFSNLIEKKAITTNARTKVVVAFDEFQTLFKQTVKTAEHYKNYTNLIKKVKSILMGNENVQDRPENYRIIWSSAYPDLQNKDDVNLFKEMIMGVPRGAKGSDIFNKFDGKLVYLDRSQDYDHYPNLVQHDPHFVQITDEQKGILRNHIKSIATLSQAAFEDKDIEKKDDETSEIDWTDDLMFEDDEDDVTVDEEINSDLKPHLARVRRRKLLNLENWINPYEYITAKKGYIFHCTKYNRMVASDKELSNLKRNFFFNSPKALALANNIIKIDNEDFDKFNKKFKHVITTSAISAAGENLICIGLELQGFRWLKPIKKWRLTDQNVEEEMNEIAQKSEGKSLRSRDTSKPKTSYLLVKEKKSNITVEFDFMEDNILTSFVTLSPFVSDTKEEFKYIFDNLTAFCIRATSYQLAYVVKGKKVIKANPALGILSSVKTVKRKRVRRFYLGTFSPNSDQYKIFFMNHDDTEWISLFDENFLTRNEIEQFFLEKIEFDSSSNKFFLDVIRSTFSPQKRNEVFQAYVIYSPKSDAREEIRRVVLKNWNDPSNLHGKWASIIIVPRDQLEGINLFNAKYAHKFERPNDDAHKLQIDGRYSRWCGSSLVRNVLDRFGESSEFKSWNPFTKRADHFSIQVYTYDLEIKLEENSIKVIPSWKTTNRLSEFRIQLHRIGKGLDYSVDGFISELKKFCPKSLTEALTIKEFRSYSFKYSIIGDDNSEIIIKHENGRYTIGTQTINKSDLVIQSDNLLKMSFKLRQENASTDMLEGVHPIYSRIEEILKYRVLSVISRIVQPHYEEIDESVDKSEDSLEEDEFREVSDALANNSNSTDDIVNFFENDNFNENLIDFDERDMFAFPATMDPDESSLEVYKNVFNSKYIESSNFPKNNKVSSIFETEESPEKKYIKSIIGDKNQYGIERSDENGKVKEPVSFKRFLARKVLTPEDQKKFQEFMIFCKNYLLLNHEENMKIFYMFPSHIDLIMNLFRISLKPKSFSLIEKFLVTSSLEFRQQPVTADILVTILEDILKQNTSVGKSKKNNSMYLGVGELSRNIKEFNLNVTCFDLIQGIFKFKVSKQTAALYDILFEKSDISSHIKNKLALFINNFRGNGKDTFNTNEFFNRNKVINLFLTQPYGNFHSLVLDWIDISTQVIKPIRENIFPNLTKDVFTEKMITSEFKIDDFWRSLANNDISQDFQHDFNKFLNGDEKEREYWYERMREFFPKMVSSQKLTSTYYLPKGKKIKEVMTSKEKTLWPKQSEVYQMRLFKQSEYDASFAIQIYSLILNTTESEFDTYYKKNYDELETYFGSAIKRFLEMNQPFSSLLHPEKSEFYEPIPAKRVNLMRIVIKDKKFLRHGYGFYMSWFYNYEIFDDYYGTLKFLHREGFDKSNFSVESYVNWVKKKLEPDKGTAVLTVNLHKEFLIQRLDSLYSVYLSRLKNSTNSEAKEKGSKGKKSKQTKGDTESEINLPKSSNAFFRFASLFSVNAEAPLSKESSNMESFDTYCMRIIVESNVNFAEFAMKIMQYYVENGLKWKENAVFSRLM